MCVLLFTTSHPDYSLVLIDNRDVLISRPTAPASFWPAPYEDILAGRDLLKPEHGTWLGINRKDGRIAALTNFRSEQPDGRNGAADEEDNPRSRGAVPVDWLTREEYATERNGEDKKLEAFIEKETRGRAGASAGGFSIVCGWVENGEVELGIGSNQDAGLTKIQRGEKGTWGLSNSAFGQPWPKVEIGRRLLQDVIDTNLSSEQLVHELFNVLNTEAESELDAIEASKTRVFVPLVQLAELEKRVQRSEGQIEVPTAESEDGSREGWYGSRQQSVLLVRKDGQTTFAEKTLYFDSVRRDDFHLERHEFQLQSWTSKE